MIQYSTIYTYNNVIDAASKDRGVYMTVIIDNTPSKKYHHISELPAAIFELLKSRLYVMSQRYGCQNFFSQLYSFLTYSRELKLEVHYVRVHQTYNFWFIMWYYPCVCNSFPLFTKIVLYLHYYLSNTSINII
jgi:hypothetical protein